MKQPARLMIPPFRQTFATGVSGAVHLLLLVLAGSTWVLPTMAPQDREPQTPDEKSQFSGKAAFEILEKVCDLGPRVSASRGMIKQQQLIADHFKGLGIEVIEQPFRVRSVYRQNQMVELNNLIARFHPDRKKRLLVCCHYDTRPFADQDRRNPRASFLGANDGGSGVALLCELGKHLQDMEGPYGIDLVFFDGEEYVIDRRIHEMFLGSTYFAQQYDAQKKAGTLAVKYDYGLLVDMVADKDLQIYYEGNSLGYAGRLTRSIWGVANQLGVKEFIAEQRHKIRDDHLPLNEVAGIPTCDIIDFDYPNPAQQNKYWHTQEDKLENCSADSLDKVGRVVLEWLRQMQDLHRKSE